ncbi:esterase FE4-like [Schistocerca nitens]|uniref:esterase FE4-like n=1 Tax=Schistocerca nitens TaxID=7011 RepID=UPI0021196FF1|nr:esterase FE4-like [Schistocerca nitens]
MWLKELVHFTVVLCLFLVVITGQEYVTVDTEEGTVRGLISQTYTGKTIYRFEGIPYAEAPVGDLRFQPPVTKTAWSGVLDAVQKPPKCPQYGTGDEDCLYLNVFGPERPSENGTLKTVMVWIHGGCFTGGTGSDAIPEYFVDQDVVFVNINYRLGLLGFLSTGDDVVPGNMGLKDQMEALRWVQRNIAAFGGDPQQVTIFGESAGGASIHYHILSPLSKGLFQKAIAMSGTALSPWAFSRNATDRALRFARHLGYTGTGSADLVNFLKTVDAYTLVDDMGSALSDEDSVSLFTCIWAPSIEPQSESAVLTEEPWTLVAEGRYSYVPFMAGSCDLESLKSTQSGGTLSTEEQVSNLNENFEEIVACDIRLPTREEQLAAARSVKEFYYNGSDITLQENYTTALFSSHLFFVEGVDTVTRSMARYSSEPVFYYEFAFNGALSQYPGGPGASHGDDTLYLFPASQPDPKSDSALIRDQMTAMFANFAKYNNPTPELDSLVTEAWPEYDESSRSYLVLAEPLRTASDMFGPYMTFWHDLLP